MKFQDQILLGDCDNLIPQLDDNSISLCVTSPPYANQRSGGSTLKSNLYEGISEEEFPKWTAGWMEKLKPKLKEDGSVLIIIRPHIRNGSLSDYVLKTRLEIRKNWIECEELIWFKPDAPPLGSIKRPRRTYESILWYSLNKNPYINLFACGNANSSRTGGFAGSERFGEGAVTSKKQKKQLKSGTSRVCDVIQSTIGSLPKGVLHPAMFPQSLPEILIQTFTQEEDTVLDPFMGSGQTALASLSSNRHFVGFEKKSDYVFLAKNRVQTLHPQISC